MKKNSKRQYIILYKIGTYLLMILLIVMLFICSNFLTLKLSNCFVNWQLDPYFEIERIIVTSILTAIMGVLIQTFFKTNKMRIHISKMYRFLCRQYLSSQSAIVCRIIENFINIIYKGNFLPIHEQSNMVENILKNLSEISLGHTAAHLFIISGDAHSGKTILAKKIINDIFTREEYIFLLKKYSKSIYYYDFVSFKNQLDQILKDYERNYYYNNIIVFDNIHNLDNSKIKRILTHIIRFPNNAKCVLILTRDINYAIDDELYAEIEEKKSNSIIKTGNLSVLQFDSEYIESEDFSNFLNMLKMNQNLLNNNFIKFHLYYIYNIYLKNKNNDIKKLFNELSSFNFTNSLVKGLLFICCCALFTGIVDLNILKKWLVRKNMHIYLNTYVEIGILNKFQGIRSSEYSLHEKTARAYISYASTQVAGLNLCKDYFYFLYKNTTNDLQYRYSLPFDKERSEISFDSIIKKGNFKILYEDIIFVIDIFNLDKTKFNHEMGLLNDRIGGYKLTKNYILNLYNQTKDDKHLITLLHSDHMMYYDNGYHNTYLKLSQSNDLYLNFASNYWINHIMMHQGQWNVNNFVKLYEKLPKQLDNIANQSYEAFHVLRRFYFDALRIYYLQGVGDYNYFANILENLKFIANYLKNNLPEFDIYKYKFIYGHYIHYNLLYNYYVLEINPTKDELNFFNCNNISNAINIAMDYYFKAYKSFKKNGDKTYDYVLLRMCELSPEYVLRHILNKSEKIDIVDFQFDDYMAIIEIFDDYRDRCGINENVLEYAAFAETFKMKFSLICKLTCLNIDFDFDSIIETCANNARKYHDEYNPKYSNQYGKTRINLLTILNDYINNHDISTFMQELDVIKEICINSNYNRELNLIKFIESLNYKISMNKMIKIAKFYPIVLQ